MVGSRPTPEPPVLSVHIADEQGERADEYLLRRSPALLGAAIPIDRETVVAEDEQGVCGTRVSA